MAKKPTKKYFKYNSRSDQFFTKGNVYVAYEISPGKWSIEEDDEGDNHGMSEAQIRRWFQEVDGKEASHG